MLQVILGREEQLKKELLLRARAGLDQRRGTIVLVPEMATLKTEAELLEGLSLAGSFDLNVLSPSRLLVKVFSQKGQGRAAGRTRIDEQGKAMACALAIRDVKDQLVYYGASVDRQGFIAEISSLISDLKRAHLAPETLARYASDLPESAARDKMQDLSRVFQAYEARLAAGFVDGEDVEEAMLETIAAGRFADGQNVIATGFDVLTGDFSRVLTALEASSAYVAVLLRAWPGDGLFRPALESVGRLKALCEETGIPFGLQELPGETGLRDARAFLREQFPLDVPGEWRAPQTFLRLHTGATPYFETRFAAREIRRLHDRENVPYGRIGVFFCDESYTGIAEAVFAAFAVPCYVPRDISASAHGAARFLLASLRCAVHGMRTEDLLSLLRSGFAPIEDDEAWRMENYITANRIRGRRFLSPFDRGDLTEAAALEEARAKVAEPLAKLRETLSQSADTLSDLKAIFAYLEDCALYARLMEQEQALLARGMDAQASRGRQVWKALLRLMDEMADLHGKERLPRALLIDEIEAGLTATSLRTLPPDSESVLCALCGNSAAEGLDAVFVLGLNEGVLMPAGEALISDDERKALENREKVYIGLDADGRDDMKKLDLYSAMCAAEKHLYLTRAAASQAGDARQPHAYWNRLRRMFPLTLDEGSTIAREENADGLGPLSLQSAADEIALRFARGETLEGEWLDAWRAICKTRSDLAKKLIAAFTRREAKPLDREITGRLFMENTMSVSRLESFAACPYRHFVEYGLRPQRKKEWDLRRTEIGSFYHDAIEGITRLLPSLPDWPKVTREATDLLVEREAGRVFAAWFGEKAEESARVKAAGEKYVRILKRTAWTFTQGAQVSAFKTAGQEIVFGYADENSLPAVELRLADGRSVLLQGRIDRIDRYEGDEGVYLRVVDYKSGQKELKPSEIYYGTQLQLLLYLYAALEASDGANPAGAYYMFFRDPLLKEIDPDDKRLAEEALAKKLHLSGISLRDARILERMDSATPPLTLDVMLKKDGDFLKNKPLAALDDMARLIAHARETARKLCVAMCGGRIAPEPLAVKNRVPCDTCDIRAVCRLETRKISRKEDMKFDDLLSRLRQEAFPDT
ncbi:MAG: PD-(D/E)XK nuclease family protein [Clostridia bacterium]|nr:PD-(D/E)XK nuclease family protein [Clostridia bacterium]